VNHGFEVQGDFVFCWYQVVTELRASHCTYRSNGPNSSHRRYVAVPADCPCNSHRREQFSATMLKVCWMHTPWRGRRTEPVGRHRGEEHPRPCCETRPVSLYQGQFGWILQCHFVCDGLAKETSRFAKEKQGTAASKRRLYLQVRSSPLRLWFSVIHVRLGWTTCWRSFSRTCSRTWSSSCHRRPAVRKHRRL